jgi:hypothetical protein
MLDRTLLGWLTDWVLCFCWTTCWLAIWLIGSVFVLGHMHIGWLANWLIGCVFMLGHMLIGWYANCLSQFAVGPHADWLIGSVSVLGYMLISCLINWLTGSVFDVRPRAECLIGSVFEHSCQLFSFHSILHPAESQRQAQPVDLLLIMMALIV